MNRVLTASEYKKRLGKFLKSQPEGSASAFSLALFRRQQILRILLRDVLGLGSLSETTEELSNLADAILHISYKRIRADLAARHGEPRYVDENGEARECGMSVIALGKLGGRELNYSSDIDLMFLYAANGETDGEHPISNKEFYKKVANQYTELLSTYTAEGLCYRVDLRLRPDGSQGEVCISLDGAKSYYQTRARDWELQMLIKARVAAGDPEAGRELLRTVEPLIYSTTLDFSAVEAVSATRERISEKLNRRKLSKPAFDVKLAPGGIRDVEFLVQCLQRLHGGRVPWLRHGGTMLALSRLSDKDLLSAAEYGRLIAAYRFLRNLEHRLQFAEDRQTHSLPTAPRELDLLARKMPSAQLGSAPSGEKLLHELNAHLEAVQEIYERVIHAQRPIYYSLPPAVTPQIEAPEVVEPTSSNVIRFLDERAPALASLVSSMQLRRGAGAFEHFLEKLMPDSRLLGLLNSNPLVARSTLDIFENSPYFAEELVRQPDLIDVLGRPREFSEDPRVFAVHRFRRHLGSAPVLPPRNVSHPGRQYVPARAGVRNAAANFRTGRRGDRRLLSNGGGARCGVTPAADARIPTAPAAHGDRTGAAWNARIRSGLRRRPGVRSARRGSRGTCLLDSGLPRGSWI